MIFNDDDDDDEDLKKKRPNGTPALGVLSLQLLSNSVTLLLLIIINE